MSNYYYDKYLKIPVMLTLPFSISTAPITINEGRYDTNDEENTVKTYAVEIVLKYFDIATNKYFYYIRNIVDTIDWTYGHIEYYYLIVCTSPYVKTNISGTGGSKGQWQSPSYSNSFSDIIIINYGYNYQYSVGSLYTFSSIVSSNLILPDTYPVDGLYADGLWYTRKQLAWTPPNIKANINNALKTYADGWVNINGASRKIDSMWTKINGVLKKI